MYLQSAYLHLGKFFVLTFKHRLHLTFLSDQVTTPVIQRACTSPPLLLLIWVGSGTSDKLAQLSQKNLSNRCSEIVALLEKLGQRQIS